MPLRRKPRPIFRKTFAANAMPIREKLLIVWKKSEMRFRV